jgi:hypothetical protein
MSEVDPETIGNGQVVTITPGTIAFQQFLDGRALDRLREALPRHVIESYGPRSDGRYIVQARPWGVDDLPAGTTRRVSGEGATIAKAGDRCREALSKR